MTSPWRGLHCGAFLIIDGGQVLAESVESTEALQGRHLQMHLTGFAVFTNNNLWLTTENAASDVSSGRAELSLSVATSLM